MKKIAFVALLFTFTLTACAGKPKDKKTIAQNSTQQTNSENNKSKSKNKQTVTMEPIHLTKEEFLTKVANYEANPNEWKYLGDKPCLIDFYANWCGPCKTIAPILEELAKEYSGQIYIYKINTEEQQELASAFGIRSIPSLLFVPMEGQPQMAMGALPKATFKEAIDDVLLKKKK